MKMANFRLEKARPRKSQTEKKHDREKTKPVENISNDTAFDFMANYALSKIIYYIVYYYY